ncbi:MAG: alpha-1,4-glucan--maltose-1-phosphate maltosyltransferase [Chloroflexota bacterium]
MTTTRRSKPTPSASAARRAATQRAHASSADVDGAGVAGAAAPRELPFEIGTARTIMIERLSPELDGGRWPVKRVVGDTLHVAADIFADGHDLLDAALLVRPDGASTWSEHPMRPIDDDRWAGDAPLPENRRYRYTIEAWRDVFGHWRDGLLKKLEAGVAVPSELEEGRILLREAASRASDASNADARKADARLIQAALKRATSAKGEAATAAALSGEELLGAMRRNADRSDASRYARELEVVVDRSAARFAAWYEMFPRSQGRESGVAATFADAEWRLADIARMGFDVVYLTPIHPLGTTNRKGRNNTLVTQAGDVGSPYAIGSPQGGHADVAPELGGLDAFLHFREAVESQGMELALDLAIQASPDHPYVQSHPEWFRHRPDGTIQYAENPPKKYQDIYPLFFYGPDAADREALWREWLQIVLTWVERGVKSFRVDNPHTKPLPFWEWLIGEVQAANPEVVFLSEAFTRPKLMRALAKLGFTQSYTYFTWREGRDELRDYFTELTRSEMREYFRGNLFPNTHDINPHHLDHGQPAFVVRAVLAATLSSVYGIYSGFELCENARLGDREEYLDSERFEVRVRDWDAPGNIKPLITTLNRLRREHAALQGYDNLRFEAVTGERTLFYRKALSAGAVDPLSGEPRRWRDPVYVAVNVDPAHAERAMLHPDLPAIGIGWNEPYMLTDLVSGASRTERGPDLEMTLTPGDSAFRIFTITTPMKDR